MQEALQSWENQSLWSSLRIDGENEEWIFWGLMRGSLIIGHNGSYMSHLANNVCSCTVVIHCQHTGYYPDMTWVEKSSKSSADNYHAKILGVVKAQLLVKAAVMGRNVAGAHTPRYGCNNLGVVIYGINCKCSMLEKQAQSDFLCLFKWLISSSQIGGKMYHVRGHMDKLLCPDQLTIEEKVNCRADKLAYEALVNGVANQ
jgi:hypothetical protein